MNAILGFTDALLAGVDGPLNPEQQTSLGWVQRGGRDLLGLINEILDLSKVEAGRMELDLAAVDAEPLLEQALAMVRERAARQGVSLELEVGACLGVVLGDELKLKQVVLNLLTNAVKFTNAGGSVRLDARRAGDTLEVEVRDTGVGIANADQVHIFEAFQRGGRAARTSTEGTGLGLTLSKRFVELHGGRMWMESELGAGSRFGFSVPATPLAAAPLTARDAAPARGRAPAAAVRGDTRTVVVIDDEPLELDLVEAVLVPEGYEVVRAAHGAEGV